MKEILKNSKAGRDYHILETVEAGIALRGTEVKSLREGRGQIRDAFARIENEEVFLYNAHIDEYTFGNRLNHAAKAPRKLLLQKKEIKNLIGKTQIKGNTLVPLSLYWKNGKVKVLLALGHGKHSYDKRRDIKEREANLEARRALMWSAKNKPK